MSRVLVPVKVSMVVTKQHDQKESEEDRVISAHSPSARKVMVGTEDKNLEAETGTRPQRSTPYWPAQPTFLYTFSGLPALGWHQPQ